MKEVGKIKKIFKGFFPDETISEKRLQFRRDLCGDCIHNSDNSPNLSTIDGLRKKLTNSFCTLCKCQIIEKTQSPYEECALYLINEPKKWFKTRLETANKDDMNLTNISTNEVDLKIENDTFVIDFGLVETVEDTMIKLIVDSDSVEEFKLISVKTTCGCAMVKFMPGNNEGTIDLKMNLDILPKGKFKKEMHIRYNLNITPVTEIVVLTGFKK